VYSQIKDSPTRGDALLDVYLFRPKSSVTSTNIVLGIIYHCGILIEVEWVGDFSKPEVEMIVPMYNKTDVFGLQIFHRDKFPVWASNSSSVEEIWNNYKNIVNESLEHFVPHKIIRKILDPEY
jgi:hypothetical protein